MLEKGEPAHIANIASVAALNARPYTAPYGVSKHGVAALTDAVALELAEFGDTVTASVVYPAAVATAIFSRAETAADDGTAESDRLQMNATIARDGISPEAAAETIFAGIAQGRSRIHTDPDLSEQMIIARFNNLQESVQ
jgi:short-subunit dehydrogenase